MKHSDCLYNFLLIVVDGITVYAILCGSFYLCRLCGIADTASVALKLFYLPLVAIVINSFAKLYGGSFFYPGLGVNRVEELKRLTLCVLFAYAIVFCGLLLTGGMARFSRAALVVGMLLTMVGMPLVRMELFPRLCRRFGIFRKRILIVDIGGRGRSFAREVENAPYWNVRIAGFLSDGDPGPDVLGRPEDYARVAAETGISYVVLCAPQEFRDQWIRKFLKTFDHVLWIPESREFPILRAYPTAIGVTGGLEISNRLHMNNYRLIKKVTEFLLAVLIMPAIILLGLLIGVLIKLTSRGPVFYRAKRLGINGRPISVLKFRTMYQDVDAALEKMLEENPQMKKEWLERFKLRKDPRVTPLGHFLRKTSIDELPQFWNVIRGEMAVIGPRPIVEDEVKYYGGDYPIFSMIKPGITGLWQVSGRSNTTYETRVRLDVYYVLNWSVWLDYYIFLQTVLAVILRRGAA